MYNRYIRNDSGLHERIPHPEPQSEQPHTPPPPREDPPDGLTGLLRHTLDRFHLDGVDTGDLLILGLLFLLFREGADDELLAALGLLLIL